MDLLDQLVVADAELDQAFATLQDHQHLFSPSQRDYMYRRLQLRRTQIARAKEFLSWMDSEVSEEDV